MDKKIILFGASWCGHCDVMKTLLEKKSIPYYYVDADVEEEKLEKMGITDIPYIEFYNPGEDSPYLSVSGTLDEKELDEILRQ